jgi:hypothetical protein
VTAPRSLEKGRPPWYVRPAVVLPLVAALIILSALLTPQQNAGRSGDQRLSTYSTAPMGGKLFFEMAQRLGWSAEQRNTPDWPADTDAIMAELAPVVPLRSSDVHTLLERVRHGGALLVMLGNASRLIADSLHIGIGLGGQRLRRPRSETAGCLDDSKQPLATRFLYTIWPGDQVTLTTIAWSGLARYPVTSIVETDAIPGSSQSRVVAAGFPYGRGRIVVGADPDLLRNDALRVCKYGLDITAVRMLDYLDDRGDSTANPRRHIVFDEYHQGYGEQRGTMSAVSAYLIGASSGRLLFQLLAAGLVLLLAVAPRLIPPHDPERIERRSPLEHVDALGRAYAQVGATRSATARLVRGVRRRLAGGAIRPGIDASDVAFLDRATRDAPQLAGQIALIKNALRTPVSRHEFSSVGAALELLELSLTRI